MNTRRSAPAFRERGRAGTALAHLPAMPTTPPRTDRNPDAPTENRSICRWCGSPVRVLEGDGYRLTRCRSLRCWWWRLEDEHGQAEVQVELRRVVGCTGGGAA